MGFLDNLFGTKSRKEKHAMESSAMHNHAAMATTPKEVDPVCGMEVDPKTDAAKSEYMGKTYYFCAPGCKKTFDANPAKYVQSGDPKMAGHNHGGGCCC